MQIEIGIKCVTINYMITIDEMRQKVSPIFKEYGVEYAGVFGSVARGETRTDSDVDLLVRLTTPIGLLKFFKLNDELEEILGRKVDLVTMSSLNRHLKPYVLADLRTLYEV